MAYVIAEPCIGTKDTACVDACPVDCIHPKKNTTYDDGRPTFDTVPQLYIDPVECIDCGACVPVCPVSAIFVLDDLPEKWKQYTELNESYAKGGNSRLESMPNTRSSSPDCGSPANHFQFAATIFIEKPRSARQCTYGRQPKIGDSGPEWCAVSDNRRLVGPVRRADFRLFHVTRFKMR